LKAIRWCFALFLLVGSSSSPSAAAEKPAQPPGWKTGSEPLQVDAKTLETFSGGELVVFQGDVSAKQGTMTLQADRVDVTVDKQTRAVKTIKARGNVRIRREEVLATGREAVYDAQTGVTVLTGDPKVWRDRDVVAGDKITLYLAEDRSVVEGARAVIHEPRPPEKPAKAGP
jgi:lipopolysaccharide export system protein LptA